MKAVVRKHQRSSAVLAIKQKSSCQIMKTRIDFRGEKVSVSHEMKECFRQLLDMLPDVPRDDEGNIDGTDLIQYVIDYILDLELQLDGPVPTSSAYLSSWRPQLSTDTHIREPLTEKSIDNTASTQVPVRRLSFSDDSLLKRADCEIRPSSR